MDHVQITTYGVGSQGVFAQSVGGGGGSGGAYSSAVAGLEGTGTGTVSGKSSGTYASASSGVAIAAGLGGTGGGGGDGGTVSVTSANSIYTAGTSSAGLFAQSVGGGGGLGGGAATNANSGTFLVGFGLGGAGGTGGIGGAVTVSQTGAISTLGDLSYGLFAQSVGGGGGAAGASSDTSVGAASASLSMSLGGTAGTGQAGGAVEVTLGNDVSTQGALATAVVAQSVGGGGGVGGAVSSTSTGVGTAAGTFGLGSSDGAGGVGGAVSVTLTGSAVSTTGAAAMGILAQSIGGGGGLSGGTTGMVDLSQYTGVLRLGNTTTNITDAGGSGGTVNISTTGSSITTGGLLGYGILAQSIGGGGGAASTVLSTSGTSTAASADMQLGGTAGGTAQNGGAVTVSSGGAISTYGAGAIGVVAQSIGGSGGIGAFVLDGTSSTSVDIQGTSVLGSGPSSGGDGGGVTVTSSASVTTRGAYAPAVLAQSIGGGGGVAMAIAGTAASLGFGGTTTLGYEASGNGGTVNVTTTAGAISTSSNMSHGIVAQSVGGGGGMTTPTGTLVLGGTSTSSGDGGKVIVETASQITTGGATSVGILAQSVGGGGGIGLAPEAQLGGTASSADGGVVHVTSGGAIYTSGTNSVGILAQSVGGGGGIVLSTGNTVGVTLQQGNGTGGEVIVTVNAPITTTGAGAYGVFAQSVSGGGGLVMDGTTLQGLQGDSSASGEVTVNANANIVVSGANAHAIKAEGNGDPIINIAAGVSVVGGTGGTAITSIGLDSHITNYGTLSTVDGSGGLAIVTSGGPTVVTNGGTILGNLSLAAGAINLVDNRASGTILAGTSLDLGGADGVLRNAGTLRSGASVPGVTTINGSLVQTSTGVLVVRADQAAGQADRFVVSGSATLGGSVRGTLLNPGLAKPGSFTTSFLTANGGVNASGLSVLGNTAILGYALSGSGNSLRLGTTVNFAPGGLSSRGQTTGGAIGAIQNAGSSPLFQTIVPALLSISNVGSLDQGYDTVAGSAVSLVPQAMLGGASFAISAITNHLDRVRTGTSTAGPQGAAAAGQQGAVAEACPCSGEDNAFSRSMWGTIMGAAVTGGGLQGQVFGGTAGIDGELTNTPLLLGAAINYSNTGLSASNYGASTSTNFGSVSLYGLYDAGPAYLSAIATLGYGGTNFGRNLYGIGLNLSTSSQFEGLVLGGRIEGGYGFAIPGTPAKLTPFVAFQPMQLWMGSASESFGALGPGLTFANTAITALPIYAGLQLNGTWKTDTGMDISPFLRLAWMHDFSPERNVSRSFAELPNFSFNGSAIPTVANAVDLHAGLQFGVGPNMSFSATVEAQISSSYSTIGASGRLRISW